MFFRSKKVIGLDIGTSSIKLAELEVSRKESTLVSFGFSPTPSGAVNAGEIVDPLAVADAIKGLIAQVKTKRKNVVTGMWGPSVIVKKIGMPKMEENLIAEQIKWEAEQYIPFDIKEISLEYHVLNSSQSGTDNMEVLLVAAKQDFILHYVEVIEAAGLKCSVIDVSGFALANCYELNYQNEQPGVNALLNIGAGVTNFVVMENSEVVFCRDIPVGGLTYTNDIHKEMGVSLEEAESLKISTCMGQEVPGEVNQIISQTNEVIAEEIHHSFDFFGATTSGQSINKFYVTGGSSTVTGLVDQISQVVGIKSEIFDPFAKVGFNESVFSPDYVNQIRPYASVALGLAFRQEA